MTLPFVIHIAATFFAYGAFFVSFTSSIFYLAQSNVLKRKRPGHLFYKLPSLETLHEIINETLDWGFLLLTLGMVFAGLWLFKMEGAVSDWHTGGKLVLSLLVWVIYGLIMVTKGLGFAKGKNAALLSLGAFGFAMAAFLGARLVGTF
jgi:HemX protein